MYINVIMEFSELLVPLPMHEATGMHVLNRRHRQQQAEMYRQATPGLMLAWRTLRSALLRPPLLSQAHLQPDSAVSVILLERGGSVALSNLLLAHHGVTLLHVAQGSRCAVKISLGMLAHEASVLQPQHHVGAPLSRRP